MSQVSHAEREEISPVGHLLMGIAGCLALSCRGVFLKKHLRGINLEVVVTGERTPGPDRGLSAIVVSAIFRGPVTTAEAVAIVEEAKPLCTVTNSVLLTPTLRYEIQAIQPRSFNSIPRYIRPTTADSDSILQMAPR